MSSAPPYHLRTNKAVERLLFMELLSKLDGVIPNGIANYTYVGMGGPYLEEFGLLQSLFACKRRMISLETDINILTRQEINRPHSRINLTQNSTSEFVEGYKPGKIPLLVWFDYSRSEWKKQLAESCELLPKLPALSIFKITLRCQVRDLGGANDPNPVAFRLKKLKSIFSGQFTEQDVHSEKFPLTLFRILRTAIAEAVPDSAQRVVRSLSAYLYDDSTPILTATMIVGPEQQVSDVIEGARLSRWPYATLNWTGPKTIDIPHLGLRERLAIDRLLPNFTARGVLRQLKLALSESREDSLAALERYIEFYRHVPHFLKFTP